LSFEEMGRTEDRQAYEFSKDIIDYLHKTSGDSYVEISRKIGVSQSFISQVIHRTKNLTLERLMLIAEAYKTPLPLLLLGATREKDVPKELKPLYQSMRELLEQGNYFRRSLKRK